MRRSREVDGEAEFCVEEEAESVLLAALAIFVAKDRAREADKLDSTALSAILCPLRRRRSLRGLDRGVVITVV